MSIALLGLSSCRENGDDFDLYRSYHEAAKGLEVYCWEQDKSWYSAIRIRKLFNILSI